MLTSTEAFLVPVEKWVKSVRAEEFGEARRQAEGLARAGELLAIHPQMIQCFRKHVEGCEPKTALLHLCQFLMCATDGRALGLKQLVRKGSAASQA